MPNFKQIIIIAMASTAFMAIPILFYYNQNIKESFSVGCLLFFYSILSYWGAKAKRLTAEWIIFFTIFPSLLIMMGPSVNMLSKKHLSGFNFMPLNLQDYLELAFGLSIILISFYLPSVILKKLIKK